MDSDYPKPLTLVVGSKGGTWLKVGSSERLYSWKEADGLYVLDWHQEEGDLVATGAILGP